MQTANSEMAPTIEESDAEAAVAAAARRCSNRGRWGADDVLGTLNHLDEAKRRVK